MRLKTDQKLQAAPLLAKQRLLFFGRRIPGNIALAQGMLQYVTPFVDTFRVQQDLEQACSMCTCGYRLRCLCSMPRCEDRCRAR